MKSFWRVSLMLLILGVLLVAVGCGDDDQSSSSDYGVSGDDDFSSVSDDDSTSDDDDTTGDDDDSTPGENVEVFKQGEELVIQNSRASLRFNTTRNTYSIFGSSVNPIIADAHIQVASHVVVPAHRWIAAQMTFAQWSETEVDLPLGQGKSLQIKLSAPDGAPDLEIEFFMLNGKGAIFAQVGATNNTGQPIKIGSIYPLLADAPQSALFFGHKRDLRILTNGIVNYADFIAPIFPGTIPTLSSWSSLIYNQVKGTSLMVGFLTYEAAQPMVYNAPQSRDVNMQSLHAACEYEPALTIADQETLHCEWMVLDFEQPTPQDALEIYAGRIKTWQNISTWTERHPEIGVPVGWNSWSASGSGGYGTSINEQIIVDNMDFADAQLRKWGMNYFQIDDGWAVKVGDWQINQTRFPDHGAQNGIEWLFDRANQMGFQNGIWMAAFNARPEAQIVADHPEYFADVWLNWLIQPDEMTLDLTAPDSRAHLTDTLNMLKDWGVQWFKLDFAYLSALTENWYAPNITRGQYYRQGVKLVRDTLGDDVFFLNVALVGWNYGLIDSMRLTLDTMPVWEGEAPLDPITNQGLKVGYRDCIRKYYLNHRVWVNHPDLIFFRAHSDPGYAPLTLDESRTFISAVALQSGLVKMGDKLVDLTTEAVDSLRRIMPVVVLPDNRPLDLMSREYPEVWAVKADEFDEPYSVVGLLNWGTNFDLIKSPRRFMPDTERELGIESLSEVWLDPEQTYLAFEFWTQEYLGEVTERFSMMVPPHTPRIVALRPKLDRPMFLGTNRHIMGGAGVIRSIQWNDTGRVLIGEQEGSIGTPHAPFTHRLTFYVPEGFEVDTVDVSSPADYAIENLDSQIDGEILTVTFEVAATTKTTDLQFPDVTWELAF